ncbi:MAG: hypothetical protein WD179_09045 [Actinomycetota bacterium]
MCVFFDEAEITGYELLKRSGIDFEDEPFGYGHAICKIGPDGCDTSEGEDCFCDKSNSWGYYIRNSNDASWALSSLGADARKVRDGYLDGWSWGANGAQPKPPALKFGDVCPAAATGSRPDENPAPTQKNGTDSLPATGDPSDSQERDDEATSPDDDEPAGPPSAEVSVTLASDSPAPTSANDDQAASGSLDDAEPRNYLTFAGFIAAFALAATAAYFMRRRRVR